MAEDGEVVSEIELVLFDHLRCVEILARKGRVRDLRRGCAGGELRLREGGGGGRVCASLRVVGG